MWYDLVERTFFLEKLYNNQVPDLENIIINKMILGQEGDYLDLYFAMPFPPSNLPLKWKNKKFNTINVVLSILNPKFKMQNLSSQGKGINIEIIEISELVNGQIQLLARSKQGIINQIIGPSIYIRDLIPS